MSTCDWLTLETLLGSPPIMPENDDGHWSTLVTRCLEVT